MPRQESAFDRHRKSGACRIIHVDDGLATAGGLTTLIGRAQALPAEPVDTVDHHSTMPWLVRSPNSSSSRTEDCRNTFTADMKLSHSDVLQCCVLVIILVIAVQFGEASRAIFHMAILSRISVCSRDSPPSAERVALNGEQRERRSQGRRRTDDPHQHIAAQ